MPAAAGTACVITPHARAPARVAVTPPEPTAAASTSALDAFLAGVERRAFRMAELALGHREDALDTVQDAMLRFVAYRDRPEAEWTPLFWSILRRAVTDRYRRAAVRRGVMTVLGRGDDRDEDPLQMLPDPIEDPAARHADGEAWAALGRALRRLPARQREAYLLRELQGLDVAGTAAAMGCSEGSVKTHLSRAMSALRTHLEDWR